MTNRYATGWEFAACRASYSRAGVAKSTDRRSHRNRYWRPWTIRLGYEWCSTPKGEK